MRRRQLEQTTINIRLFYNDKEITRTKNIKLNSLTFTAQIKNLGSDQFLNNQNNNSVIIKAVVKDIPESIKAEIHESVFNN